jgi:hypothetical protein
MCNVTNGELSFFSSFAPLYFYYLDISTIINYILFILLINYIY